MNDAANALHDATHRVLLVGAGGIGSNLLSLVSAGLRTGTTSLTVLDGDLIEDRNLPHQRFSEADVGRPKAEVLEERFSTPHLQVAGRIDNLRSPEQVEGYDLIIVAVDRPEPRRLVHASGVPWIDLRSTGRGTLVLTHLDDPRRIVEQTPDHAPASCQADGVLERGFVQFGFALAATIGAQWLVDHVVHGSSPTTAFMVDAAYGGLRFSPLPEVSA